MMKLLHYLCVIFRVPVTETVPIRRLRAKMASGITVRLYKRNAIPHSDGSDDSAAYPHKRTATPHTDASDDSAAHHQRKFWA